jgi:hypothetical protein
VAYNGPVMGFVGSIIELCGSVMTNSGEKKFFYYWLSFTKCICVQNQAS